MFRRLEMEFDNTDVVGVRERRELVKS